MAMLKGCWERVCTCGPGMPRDSLSPRVAVYSLIWRALLALAITSPYRESTLPRSSSTFRSCIVFSSCYYSLQDLYHIAACLLAVPVDDLVVELVAGRYLLERRGHAPLQRLRGLRSPPLQASARLLDGGGPHEDHHQIGRAHV